jgi:hypothetical protein
MTDDSDNMQTQQRASCSLLAGTFATGFVLSVLATILDGPVSGGLVVLGWPMILVPLLEVLRRFVAAIRAGDIEN